MPKEIPRRQFQELYGPTVGDRVRLADTDLFIEIEEDRTTYGEELRYGVGRLVRDGMGQSQITRAAGAVDTVITDAIIIDHWGIIKADIGIKDGRIAGIGEAGNPDVQPDIDIVVGPGTEVISAESRIVTAGGIDVHVHFTSPLVLQEALFAGVTTIMGGGTGPAMGSIATLCTPGPWHLERMLQAVEGLPINFGLYAKGNSSTPDALEEQLRAGACGLKIHEGYGATPAVIDCGLGVAERFDVQVMLHSDSLNESGFVESTMAAFKGRTIHHFHVEGAGGGHAPDIIRVCGLANVLPSSTTPTMPYGANTPDEIFDMIVVAHDLRYQSPGDVAAAESRIRKETMAAEDLLNDMGAISIMSSDAQAMGRSGETILNTWQTADKMKKQFGALTEEKGDNDNFRVKRYISKYTINPAIAQGISRYVGSIEVGKLADLVVWQPQFFGVKPSLVLKCGSIAAAPAGDPNASVPPPQPRVMTPMFANFRRNKTESAVTFVSGAALDAGIGGAYGLERRLLAVENTRGLSKSSMIHNALLPKIEVDPETYEVRADGKLLTCEPAKVVAMAQRYFLY